MSLDIAPFLAVGLDVSFANVNLAEAKLMLVGAQDDVTAAFAQLAAALGYQDNRFFSLVDEPTPGAPPRRASVSIATSLGDPLRSSRLRGLTPAQSHREGPKCAKECEGFIGCSQNRTFRANWICRAEPLSPGGKRVLSMMPKFLAPTILPGCPKLG